MFEDALAGVEAGRAGGFGFVVGVDRVGQADALRAHGADVVVDDLAELLGPRDRAPGTSPSSRGRCARPSSTSTCSRRPSRCSRSSNGHIGLRGNLDEGEPFGLPGTYLNAFYELRPLPYAEAGYGYPEAGQTVVNVTERQDHPAARRRRAVRRPLRPAARARARARPARRRAAADAWSGLAGRRRPCASARRGWSRSRSARSRRSCYEVEPLDGPVRVVVQSELVANEPAPRARRDPRAAAALESPLVSEEFFDHGAARRARPLDHGAAAADGGRDGPRGRRAAGDGRRGREPRRPRPADGHRRPRARAAPAGRQVPRLRLVEPALAAGAPRPGRRRRWPRRGTPAGTGWSPAQRAYLDDFWERADVEIDGDAELQQAVRFALFHTLQAGARAEQRAIAAKGLTGPGLRRPHVLGHRALRPAGAHLHRAGRGAGRAALAPRDARPRARARAPARARGRGVPVADDPRRGVLGLLAGRHRRVPHQRRHRRRRRPLPGRDRRRGVRARGRPRAARRDRAAVALARPPRPAGALPHRRRHRPRRVQRDRRQQRLHEPDGAAEPARRRRRRRAPPPPRRRARRRPRGGGGVARRRPRHAHPLRRRARRPPAGGGLHRATRSGTSSARCPSSTRCCCTSPTSTSTASRSSSRPTSCSRCTSAATPSPTRRRRANFAYYEALTVRDSSLSACTQAVIAAEVGHLELAYDYFARGRADGPRRPRAQHARRPAHRLARRRLDRRRRRLRRHARPRRRAQLRAAPARPARAARLPPRLPRPPAAGRGRRKEQADLLAARRAAARDRPPRQADHVVAPDGPVTEPIPPAVSRASPSQPPGRAPARRGRTPD